MAGQLLNDLRRGASHREVRAEGVTEHVEVPRRLEAREALCSTGLPGGLALLHSRFPDPYVFDSPFIVLGRTVQEIPFGAPDGGATDLFFLLGCPDDRLHLHTLARLCLMAQKTDVLARLRSAPDAATMHQSILEAEQAVLGNKSAAQREA